MAPAVSNSTRRFAPAIWARDLPPNIFAIVMATGIVALAINAVGYTSLALGLFAIGAAVYVVLGAMLLIRCVCFHRQLATDLATHAKAPGFFTIVAGTGVLGNCFLLLIGWQHAAEGLFVAAFLFWALLTYSILPQLIEAENKPPLEKALSGVWLLAVVATQSVSILAGLLAPKLPESVAGPALFLGMCLWLIGVMLYLWLIALIFYRMTFLPLTPADLTPPYWINMGAMAISVVAGVTLASNAHRFTVLAELLPFIKGMTWLYWATATWWLPLLVALGFWRHVLRRFPLQYDHSYWGMVFPLGMYSLCTQRLGREFGPEFVVPLGELFAWIGLIAWCLTALGLGRHVVRRLSQSAPD